MESLLLRGETFSYIKEIERDGLEDLYSILSSGDVQGVVFGKGVKFKPEQPGKKINPLRSHCSSSDPVTSLSIRS